jgi:hypothetical protein
MLNFNVFENIDLNCFCSSKKSRKKTYEDKDNENEYNISILPITPNFDIENLYPLTNHVDTWSIFIVGNDKTYILVDVNDPHINIPKTNLCNRQGQNLLPKNLLNMFDNIWNVTLENKQLQFFILWNNKLFLSNTYPFLNGNNKVIGAILFMRAFETQKDMKFSNLQDYITLHK